MDKYDFREYLMTKFDFQASMYSEFQGGALKSRDWVAVHISGELTYDSSCNTKSIRCRIHPNPILYLIDSQFVFDGCRGANDRLLLYSLPEDTNAHIPVLGILNTLRVPPTRTSKIYSCSEPVVGSVFTDNGKVVKVSFTMANPERLIEFENSGRLGGLSVVDKNEDELFNIAKTMGRTVDMDDVEFVSNAHQRFERGTSMGLKHFHRKICIKRNVDGCDGYDVKAGDGYVISILNLDGVHPLWGSNVQMTPKPMRLVHQSDSESEFRGFNCRAMGPYGWVDFSGADYGLLVKHPGGKIEKCILYMYDRNTYIEYYDDITFVFE